MSLSVRPFKWLLCVLFTVSMVAASPTNPPPVCGGNICYPVLIGPILQPIAKDYCSYYLKLPRTTTITVKTTSTATEGYTKPAQTVSVTATTQATATATVTTTATAAGQIVTSTVTETATVNNVKKRDPLPGYTPPKGSGLDYKLPQLAAYAPAVISAACSCIVTPTTVTVSSTAQATATTTQTVTPAPVTTIIATVTNTITTTVTQPATVSEAPTTTTVIETTTTTAGPAQTCDGNPGTPQRSVTGFLNAQASKYPPRQVTPAGLGSAEACYTYCKNFRSPYPNDPNVIRSYTYTAGSGFCSCYTSQVCLVLDNDLAGDTQGGDVVLPF